MSSSSASSLPLASALGLPVTEKLNKTNHTMWKAQVLPPIRAAGLFGFLDGTKKAPEEFIVSKGTDGKEVSVPNPDYAVWVAQDQLVLGFLNASLSREALQGIATKDTSAEVWAALQATYASHSRARAINTRLALATTQKGTLSVIDYVNKMKSLADNMASAGKPIDNEELVSYILARLDLDFNPVISAVAARVEPISVAELLEQLISFESRFELLQGSGSHSSANAATRGGRGGFNQRGAQGRAPPPSQGRGNDNRGHNGGSGNNNGGNRPKCQLCGRLGHTVVKCYKRFDRNFTGEEKTAAAASSSYGADPLWYTDSGATDHITNELEKLTARDKYNGSEQIHTASGAGPGNEEGPSSRQM